LSIGLAPLFIRGVSNISRGMYRSRASWISSKISWASC